jgi:hypothetical protein
VTDPIDYLRVVQWQVEPEWSETVDHGFAHWPHRLRQVVTRVEDNDGMALWTATTDVLREVRDLHRALELCHGLNRAAAGWAYVVDEPARVIRAVTTFYGQRDWDQPYARWSTAALVSFWHADTIADSLAHAVGGIADASHPRSSTGLRPDPDGMFHYVQAIRARPEWVFDPTVQALPNMEELAEAVIAHIGPEALGSASTETCLRVTGFDLVLEDAMEVEASQPLLLPPSATYEITAELEHREPYGLGFVTRIRIPTELSGDSTPAALANRLNQILATQYSSAGAFYVTKHNIWYELFVPGFALRNMQVGPSRPNGAALLLGVVAGLHPALACVAGAGIAGDYPADELARDQSVEELLRVFELPAIEALAGVPNPRPGRADRRYLWAADAVTLCHFGIFNPAGPTLTTLQLAPLDDGNVAVLYLMRHPFSPDFKELGRFSDIETLQTLIGSTLPNELGSMPEFLWIVAPKSAHDHTLGGMWNAFAELAEADQNADVDLAWEAAKLRHFAGRAWDRLNNREPVPQPKRSGEGIMNVTYASPPGRARDFEDWLYAAADTDNVFGTLFAFPSAWDGAINYHTEHGSLGMFDME